MDSSNFKAELKNYAFRDFPQQIAPRLAHKIWLQSIDALPDQTLWIIRI